MPFISRLKELGWTVEAAYRDNSADKQGLDTSALDSVYEVPFSRSPYSLDNVRAYSVLKKIIDSNDYDIIHCHTPMGAVVTRLAAKNARKKGTKVIYTAHGFHFYQGASAFSWKVFYQIEKYLSKYTDCIITINREDYKLASERFTDCKKIVHINGVGVDLSRFKPVSEEEKQALRREYGYPDDCFMMIYPADFCDRKNQLMLLEAVREVYAKHKNIRLLLPGLTTYADGSRQFIEQNGLGEIVEIMDYRRDIYNLDALCDLSVSSSKQEGLPINLIEAMALGNPIVATDVRGNNDLVCDGVNGYLVPLGDSHKMAERIITLIENPELIKAFGEKSAALVKGYGCGEVNEALLNVYKSVIGG
jgi:glycosyltransferase EpsD